MNRVDSLRLLVRIALIIGAICSTSLPALYAFSPWRSRTIGKLFMAQALALAATIDLWCILQLWPPNLLVHYYLDAVVLTAVALATAGLTIFLWRVNRPKKNGQMYEDQTHD